MPIMLRADSWEDPRRFLAEGGAQVKLTAPAEVGLGLEVEGLSTPAQRRGGTGAGFSLTHVPAEGATLVAVSRTGTPFPPGTRLTADLAFPQGAESVVIQDCDVSGRSRAPVARLVPDGSGWMLVPAARTRSAGSRARAGAGGTDTGGPDIGGPDIGSLEARAIGRWVATRLRENQVPCAPRMGRVHVDRSVSMRRHQEHVAALLGFLQGLNDGAGRRPIAVQDAPVGGQTADGVGSVEVTADAGSRDVLITDLPSRREGLDVVMVGDPELLAVLPVAAGTTYAIAAAQWDELLRTEQDVTDRTVQHLAPLVAWLAGTGD